MSKEVGGWKREVLEIKARAISQFSVMKYNTFEVLLVQ